MHEEPKLGQDSTKACLQEAIRAADDLRFIHSDAYLSMRPEVTECEGFS